MAVKTDPRLKEPLEGRGPGAHLRNAREEAGMTVGAVAEALLLNSETLELIEADAHDRLPAPTFVRGYLRGYARVLGLPSGPILDMYDRQGFEPPALTNEVADSPQAHTSDIPVRLVTYAVAVALALLVGLWWHSQEDGGFAISGDLFDWSPGADQDPSLPTAEGSGTPADEADARESSVAAASDPTDEVPQDDEPTGQPRVGEAASGNAASPDTAPAGTGAEGAPVAMPSLAPDTTLGDEESPLSPPPGDAAPVEAAAAQAARTGAGAELEPVAMRSLAPDTTPSDVEFLPAAPADSGSPGGSAAAEAVPAGTEAAGAPVVRASLQPDTVPEDAESEPVAVGGEASATQQPQTEAVAGIGRGADPGDGVGIGGAGGTDVPVPEGFVAADSADESAGAALTGAPASDTDRAATDTRADSTAAAGTARSGLVLEFAHESWVEVYDRERARLFFNLVQPGRLLALDGPRPFDVLLGYGKDVRVTIDGEAFDHTPYLRHGVARFSIGSERAGGTSVAESGGTTMSTPADSPAEPSAPPDRGG